VDATGRRVGVLAGGLREPPLTREVLTGESARREPSSNFTIMKTTPRTLRSSDFTRQVIAR
jgi:hypothetical protein